MEAVCKKVECRYLDGLEDELNVCIRCAYCFEGCPTFKVLGWDSDGPRGRIILAYGILTGELEPTDETAMKLLQCTTCRDCEERCSSNVSVVEIIQSARAELVEAGCALDAHKVVIGNVKSTGNIYGDTEVMVPEQDGDVPFFLGCQYSSRPNKVKKFIKILQKLGIEPKVQKEICCGFPMEVLGFKEDFAEHKKKFAESFKDGEAIAVCPTCTIFLKEGHGVESKHILQTILEKLPEANLDMKVTYHDPCDFSRGLGLIDEPRQVLERLGVEVVEMEHHGKQSLCCGGGGGILMSDAELSDEMAMRRMKEALDTGADTIVTSCPTCETVLKKAATRAASEGERTVQVRNIEDIIWKALK
jgi:Fe-S oxidoreductase